MTLVSKYNTSNMQKFLHDIDRYFRILFPSDKHTTSVYENRFNFIPSTINDNKLNQDVSLSTSNYDDFKSNKCLSSC